MDFLVMIGNLFTKKSKTNMNKSLIVVVVIIFVLAIAGFVAYKNSTSSLSSNPIQLNPVPTQIATPTPEQNIDQQALDKELDQMDQVAKSIQDNNDKDSDLNNLTL